MMLQLEYLLRRQVIIAESTNIVDCQIGIPGALNVALPLLCFCCLSIKGCYFFS